MKIVVGYPPNYEDILKKFDITGRNVVFTYGDILYVPYKDDVPGHLLVHESVHSRQQGSDPVGWWDKYIKYSVFRYAQEIEAYREQFRFYKGQNKRWLPFLKKIASDLSSKMYGNIISYQEAYRQIII